MSENIKSNTGSRIVLFLFIIIITSIVFNACKENSEDVTLGEEFIESQTHLNLIDTFSVSLSTVLLDSVITSGTGSILVGNYSDDIFGKISCRSYFQIGLPDSSEINDEDAYDSLNLVIKYNNYYFGDTTQNQSLFVYQLTENIEYSSDTSLSANASFNYNPEPVGSIVYLPRPYNPVDTLSIKISDNIGFDLFTKLKDGSETVDGNESFINYFHGLMLASGDSYGGSIIGFSASDVRLVLHTTRKSVLSTYDINYDFGLNTSSKQFNHITHDFSSTDLSGLVDQRNKLPDSETNDLSFLQGGTGLTIRIDFPTLKELLLHDRGTVMSVQLLISPKQGSYNDFALPQQLYLYQSDKLNRENGSVFTGDGTIATSTLTVDELYNEGTYYSFDLTSYIEDAKAASYIDPDKGLLVTLPPDQINTVFNRLIINSKNINTKLKIYYLSY